MLDPMIAVAALVGVAAHLAVTAVHDTVAFVRGFCRGFVRSFRQGFREARAKAEAAERRREAKTFGPWGGPPPRPDGL